MCSHIEKQLKKLVPCLAFICLLSLSPLFSVNFAFAEGYSSYFDDAAAACIVENYNSETSSSVTSIEDVDFSKITTLNCSNKGIGRIRSLALMPNLVSVDISGNTEMMSAIDISENSSLESFDASGIKNLSVYGGSNEKLETLKVNDAILIGFAFGKKNPESDDTDQKKNIVDVTALKFLSTQPWKLTEDKNYSWLTNTSEEKVIEFDLSDESTEDIVGKNLMPVFNLYGSEDETTPLYSFKLYTDMKIVSATAVDEDTGDFLGKASVVKFYGDSFSTDELIDLMRKKDEKISLYSVTDVKNVFESNKPLEYTVDEKTLKEGIIGHDSLSYEILMKSNAPAVPDTGLFTNSDGTLKPVNIIIFADIIAIITVGAFVIEERIRKRAEIYEFDQSDADFTESSNVENISESVEVSHSPTYFSPKTEQEPPVKPEDFPKSDPYKS